MYRLNFKRELRKIVKNLKENYKPDKIILFGSFAYGKIKENSDVDLVLIKKTKDSYPSRLLKVAEYIDSDLGTDVLVFTPKEWRDALDEENYFVKEINKKGKVIYEKK